MGSEINFGDKIFPAFGKGKLPNSEVSKRQSRWTAQSSNQALTAISGVAAFAATMPVSINNLIRIKNVIVTAYFSDSSAGSIYNVSEMATFYVYQSNFTNLDYSTGAAIPTFPYQSQKGDFEILAQALSNGIAIDARVYGGDVLAKTLITPGVGDQIQFSIAMLYEPL